MSARIGILLSGRGSNFQAIHRATRRGEVPAEIALVVSNRKEAAGLSHALDAGLAARCLPHGEAASREAHDLAIVAALRDEGVDWVCLAGYMRLLSPELVRAFPQRILNIHPSLLPAFPGLHAQRQAIDYGVTVSGCTVHFVDEELDHGPIVLQQSVPVRAEDDEESLSNRILREEHRLYPEALRRLLVLPWTIEGRRVAFS